MTNDKNEILNMTGEQAMKHVTNLKRNSNKYGKVYIKLMPLVTYVERKEVGETGEAIDDVYGGNEFTTLGPTIDLTWKQFVSFCIQADEFSAIKQKRFEEVGRDNSSAEFGTGLTIGTRYSEDYGFVTVTVDR